MTQAEAILAHLQSGDSITTKDARRICGCERLAARINDLRKKGYPIVTHAETDGHATWARYSLAPRKPAMVCAEDGQGMLL